jgi:hypothetical protein
MKSYYQKELTREEGVNAATEYLFGKNFFILDAANDGKMVAFFMTFLMGCLVGAIIFSFVI